MGDHYLKKELYEKVRETSELFEWIQEGSLDGLWYWDIENPENEWMSPKFKQVFGYDDDEIENSSEWWQTNIHPDDLEEWLERYNAHCRGEIPYVEGLVRYPHRDGSTVWVICRGLLIRDENDTPVRMIGSHTNVTQLRKAQEEAEEANRAKDDFLARMSHEIRTPITAIYGLNELALQTNLDEEQREYLTLMRESTESLISLVNDILDAAKIGAGKIQLEATSFNLSAIVQQAVRTLEPRATEKGLDLEFAIHGRVPPVVIGDPLRIRQILLNLLDNAIRFTEKGKVQVTVDVEEVTDVYTTFGFHVSDTGIGIPPDKQALVFNEFAQADESVTRRYGGSGLGLSIAKRLVEVMGGQMNLKSEVGRGSEFTFTLTLATCEPDLPQAAAPREVVESLPELPSLRVLLAEDHKANQVLMQQTLKPYDIDLTIVSNGVEVIRELHQSNFDLILMDLEMPEMGGLETTRRIRALEKLTGERIPIIAVTAHAMPGDRERCLKAGMDAYVTKPLQPISLLHTIANVVSGEPVR